MKKKLFAILCSLAVVFSGSGVGISAACGAFNTNAAPVFENNEDDGKSASNDEKVSATAADGYWWNYRADAFAGGDGTSSNPYQIATAAQLALLSWNTSYNYVVDSKVSSTSYCRASYILMADIDLSAHFWNPIGLYYISDSQQGFYGNFNGAGHTISGMNMNLQSSTDENYSTNSKFYFGFFGIVKYSSNIHNFIIKNSTIGSSLGDISVSGGVYLGFLAAYTKGYYTALISNVGVENCSVSNKITTSSVSAYCGGFCGYADSSLTISNCYVSGDLTLSASSSSSSFAYCGGFCGDSYSTISNCYVSGNLTLSTLSASRSASCGGFCGHAGRTISNCYVSGVLTLTAASNSSSSSYGASCGGFCGETDSSTISDCYVSGDLTLSALRSSSAEAHCGGFCGYISHSSPLIHRCYVYNTNTVEGSLKGNDSGGFVGYILTGSIISSFAILNIQPTYGSRGGGQFAGYIRGGNIYSSACFNPNGWATYGYLISDSIVEIANFSDLSLAISAAASEFYTSSSYLYNASYEEYSWKGQIDEGVTSDSDAYPWVKYLNESTEVNYGLPVLTWWAKKQGYVTFGVTYSYLDETGSATSFMNEEYQAGDTVEIAQDFAELSHFSSNGWSVYGWATTNSTNKVYEATATFEYTGGISLFAIYSRTVTIVYETQGGSKVASTSGTQLCNSDGNTGNVGVGISQAEVKRNKHRFLGWSTTQSGEATYLAGGTFMFSNGLLDSNSVTLYAIYEYDETIVYDVNYTKNNTVSTVGNNVLVAAGSSTNGEHFEADMQVSMAVVFKCVGEVTDVKLNSGKVLTKNVDYAIFKVNGFVTVMIEYVIVGDEVGVGTENYITFITNGTISNFTVQSFWLKSI